MMTIIRSSSFSDLFLTCQAPTGSTVSIVADQARSTGGRLSLPEFLDPSTLLIVRSGADTTTRVRAIAADGSVQTLGDPIMRDNGTTGWKEYSYPLSGNVVCVALKGYSDYGYNIHVDRIAVSTEQSGVSTVEIADNTLVTVYNLSGARVAERMQRSDVSTLAPGCYIVRSATATEKVIVR